MVTRKDFLDPGRNDLVLFSVFCRFIVFGLLYLCKTNIKDLRKMEQQKFEKPTTNNPDLLLRIRNDKNTIGETTKSLYQQKLDKLLHQI